MSRVVEFITALPAQVVQAPRALADTGRRAKQYFKDVWAELRKVLWPKWSEVTALTSVVLVVLLVISAYVGLLNAIFHRFVMFLIGR